ncbi:Phosphatidylinositol 4-kinase stt4 [Thecaphora frezii]
MDSLDLSTHQLILDDLAANLAADIHNVPLTDAHVQAAFGPDATSSKVKTSSARYLSSAAARTHISMALFASSISSASLSLQESDVHLTPVLLQLEQLLRHLTVTEFDDNMTFSDWPLPDKLAHALVASFLTIARNVPQHRSRCFDAVLALATDLSAGLAATSGDAYAVACRLLPLFNGLYRALAATRFAWSRIEFARLAATFDPLIRSVQAVRRLDELLLALPEQHQARLQSLRATRRIKKQPTVRPKEAIDYDDSSDASVDTFYSGGDDDDAAAANGVKLIGQDGGFRFAEDDAQAAEDQRSYCLALLAHYRRIGTPLSGHYVLYRTLKLLATALGQSLAAGAKRPAEGAADHESLADRFDLDSERSSSPSAGVSCTTATADVAAEVWKVLLRYAIGASAVSVDVPAKVDAGAGSDAEQRAAAASASSVLSAIPVLGANAASSAAFGHDEPLTPRASSVYDVDRATRSALHASNRAFHSTQRYFESAALNLDEALVDLYSADILGEALRLSTLCSVALHLSSGVPVDPSAFVRIRTLLSESTPIVDETLQTAALQSVGLLVRNVAAVALPMTRVLRHFVTSPLVTFEPRADGSPSPVLVSAARCLACCVTVAPGDDLVVSTMYNLINYIGKEAGSGNTLGVGGLASSGMSMRSNASRQPTMRDHLPGMQLSGSQTALNVRSEDQKRLINLSTITVLARLALEVARPEVTALAISMLLQRLRTADLMVEAAILDNLVPLALFGPKQAYVDVIRAFSSTSRSAMTGGASRRAAVAVQAAQLKLATGLGHLDENEDRQGADAANGGVGASFGDGAPLDMAAGGRKEIYLVELLQLFAEKGMQLQQAVASNKSSSEELAELNADLAMMLPAIAAVLEHDDINPQVEPTTEMVSLFRNLWFLSVLFGFASPRNIPPARSDEAAAVAAATQKPHTAAEAQAEIVGRSLGTISLKTPTLVPETAHNYLESDLEYNSVLKREFSSATLDAQRKSLSAVIPSHASEIRSFSYAQVTFLATIYDLEWLRSRMGRPSMILWYFVNDGLNSSSLVPSMQAIADRVIDSFIQDLGRQVDRHALDPRVSSEVKALLLGTCHRVAKVRQVSQSILDKLIEALPSLLCDQDVVVTMLEVLTLLRQSCECEYRDEYSPVYHFRSERAGIAFELSDSYAQRNEILTQFLQRSRRYLGLALTLAPVELQGVLQRYLSTLDDSILPGHTELGKSVALDYARSLPASARQEGFLPQLGGWRSDASSNFVGELSAKSTYAGEMTGIHLALSHGLVELAHDPSSTLSAAKVAECRQQLQRISTDLIAKRRTPPFAELRRLLYRSAALAVALPEPDYELLHYIVSIPTLVFTNESVSTACQVWTWIIGERPDVETKIMVEIAAAWARSARTRRGLFSAALTTKHPFLRKTEMGAFNREEVTAEQEQAVRLFMPHLTLIRLVSSRFQALRYRGPAMVLALTRLILRSGEAVDRMSTHPLSREVRFALVAFGFEVLRGSRSEGLVEHQLRDALYRIALAWFAVAPQWSFGSNRLQLRADMQLMSELVDHFRIDRVRADRHLTSFPAALSSVRLPGGRPVAEAAQAFEQRRTLLLLLLENEQTHLSVWANPLGDSARGSDYVGEVAKAMTEARWPEVVQWAWSTNAAVAVQLGVRFPSKALHQELGRLVRAQPHRVVDVPSALQYVLEDHLRAARRDETDLRWLQYWAAVSPVEAIRLFQPEYDNHPLVLQYAMRALEQHPVELTFFYVPQVVQALRDDAYGYVEQFIFETSKISQLFCHQIIWNMKANSYKDDDAEVPDSMKPTLDRMVDNIVGALSGEAQEFYEREFGFFNEVTSISGKLKPYIKKSKPEKKAKIDEEMAKIRVEPGVYLPSNADGVVVDLDRKSGRPLQSHAKAPFMATFKVHREVVKPGDEGDEQTPPKKTGIDVWQSAIFKVGDDCRQDVLALQVIAMFKNIFTTVGMDLYLNPYRVTATGPGCGVIDVVANATSRDEMGRAKINHLLAFFVGRYGNADGVAFQKARLNFIQSMAAYSVVCHILQIRDRHNGNIMIDGEGHIVHIDFGFLFDIGPGGMRFEPYSFKLSHEMIDVMGGPGSQGLRMFEELVVKAFLACRPYCDEIVDVCRLMLGTELPSFKGAGTIVRLRERFRPGLSAREAANHAKWLVRDAYGNVRGVLYDKLQEVTNDIPFAR